MIIIAPNTKIGERYKERHQLTDALVINARETAKLDTLTRQDCILVGRDSGVYDGPSGRRMEAYVTEAQRVNRIRRYEEKQEDDPPTVRRFTR